MSKSVESVANNNDNVEKLIREMMDSISLLRVDVVEIRDRVQSIEDQMQKKNAAEHDSNVNSLAFNALEPTGNGNMFGKVTTTNSQTATVTLAKPQMIFGTSKRHKQRLIPKIKF